MGPILRRVISGFAPLKLTCECEDIRFLPFQIENGPENDFKSTNNRMRDQLQTSRICRLELAMHMNELTLDKMNCERHSDYLWAAAHMVAHGVAQQHCWLQREKPQRLRTTCPCGSFTTSKHCVARNDASQNHRKYRCSQAKYESINGAHVSSPTLNRARERDSASENSRRVEHTDTTGHASPCRRYA
jgi:hypothetical protein